MERGVGDALDQFRPIDRIDARGLGPRNRDWGQDQDLPEVADAKRAASDAWKNLQTSAEEPHQRKQRDDFQVDRDAGSD